MLQNMDFDENMAAVGKMKRTGDHTQTRLWEKKKAPAGIGKGQRNKESGKETFCMFHALIFGFYDDLAYLCLYI